ncbi:conserved hypothetical protein [Trichinella spiralis]|uniref:hypothetical protein n=1 Tax=Trichinella spiralis TaxID=6334 RepID=UPI0001EFE308|nr:conserved hypothetical protein [Trichinella spiralis]
MLWSRLVIDFHYFITLRLSVEECGWHLHSRPTADSAHLRALFFSFIVLDHCVYKGAKQSDKQTNKQVNIETTKRLCFALAICKLYIRRFCKLRKIILIGFKSCSR